MVLKIVKHPDGPDLPDGTTEKRFRSYVALADWADTIHLPDGKYFCRPTGAVTSLTSIREVNREGALLWVEGRGYI